MRSLVRACPAKVNLFLKVVGRRPDGYHNLITVMQPLALADELTLTLTPGDIILRCNNQELPQDARNLAFRAARRFQRALRRDFGVRIQLKKRIPLAAGLGGGSSDAAGVLLGLNALLDFPLPFAALHRLAGELGADVPFFLLSGPALGQGIGTLVTPLCLPAYWYVLLNPGFQVSTRWVYANLPQPVTAPTEEADWAGLSQRPVETWLHNDLEYVTLKAYPQLTVLKQALNAQGAQATLMSGSGPTVFGIFSSHQDAQRAAEHLEKSFPGWLTVTRGISGDHLLRATQETATWMN